MKNATAFPFAVRGGLFFCCGLVLSGCRTDALLFSPQNAPAQPPRPVQNRASQIEVLATRIVDVPFISKSKPIVKGTFPEVLVKWRNNGPEPVGMVRAKIQMWDSKGKEFPHSPETITIFFARTNVRRIRPKQVYDEPAGKGHALLFGPPKPARVKATIVYADSDAHAWDDIHVGRDAL